MSFNFLNLKRAAMILKTVREMLIDRGYVIENSDTLPRSDEECEKYYDNNEVLMQAHLSKNENVTIKVLNAREAKISKSNATHLFEEYGNQNCILIMTGMTPPAKKIIEKMKKCEVFNENELLRNPTRHKLYSPHEALSKEEEKKVLAAFKCVKDQLPGIIKFSQRGLPDPIVKYYNWDLGTVVKITRCMGGTQEPSIYYRVVRQEK
jgi:DNA-directed RNA polymerase subunit H (RpoH/RPB5)